MKPPPRPAFTTYQQSFSPIKRSNTPLTPTSSSSVTTPTTTNLQLREQTHLLHLSLLHATSDRTLKRYTSSAHASLNTRFDSLHTLYTGLLALERHARQQANLLALHRWSVGNPVSLARRLPVLTTVLADLAALTAPEGRTDDDGAALDSGPYTTVVTSFERWTDWVRQVWEMRDAQSGSVGLHGGGDSDDNDDNDTRLGDTEAQHSFGDTGSAGAGTSFTQIEGLGDGVKASMRALATTLNSLSIRLEELTEPQVRTGSPSKRAPKSRGTPVSEATSASSASTTSTSTSTPTPTHLLRVATAFVAGMVEELQVMREVEFEVVVGEQAWVQERLRGIAGDIERGLEGGVRSPW